MLGPFRRKDNRTPGKVLHSAKCKYGRYVIRNDTYRGEEARLFEVNGTRESATFFDDRKNDPVFDYIKAFIAMLDEAPSGKKILMLGGAGFQFPKYVISHCPEKTVDVVEINPLAVKLARKFFYLNDLEKEYNAESSGRLKIMIDDGLSYLENTDESYDFILNDAYHGSDPDEGLNSMYAIKLIKKHLNPGGVYGFNLITTMRGQGSMPFYITDRSLRLVFNDVRYVRCTRNADPTDSQNLLFISKDSESEEIFY